MKNVISNNGEKGWLFKRDFRIKRSKWLNLTHQVKVTGTDFHLVPWSTLLRDLMQYWESRRGDDLMPSRRDVDPVSIPPLLPYVFMVDVADCPLDFSYRLLGTGIVANSQRDYTGERLVDIPSQAPPSQIWNLYESTVRNKSPRCLFVPLLNKLGAHVEMLAMPLSQDGFNINILLGGISFDLIDKPYDKLY